MNIIRTSAMAMPLRLEAMQQISRNGIKYLPKEIIDDRIHKLVTKPVSSGVLNDIDKMIMAKIVPLTSAEVKRNPVPHLLNENDFINKCIDVGNVKLVEALCKGDFDPIPEQLVPQKLSDRTWTLIGSCRPDPLLYAIFKNRLDIAISLLHSGRYELDQTYCFPLNTVWVNANQVFYREPSDVEISPLTAAPMLPTTIEDTRHKVETVLKLGAKKEILPFNHPEYSKRHEDNSEQSLFLQKLERRREGFEAFLHQCF